MNIKFLKVNEKIENKKELMGFTWISKIVGTYKNYLILQNHQKKKYLYDTTKTLLKKKVILGLRKQKMKNGMHNQTIIADILLSARLKKIIPYME